MNLSDVRNLLLPGMWATVGGHPDLDVEMKIDDENKSLLISGYNRITKKELGFAITELSISDGSYKTSFGPSMRTLVELLTDPSTDIGFAK